MVVQIRKRLGQQDFRGTQALEFVRQRFPAFDFGQHESPAADVDPGQSEGIAALAADREQGVVAQRVEQGFVADRARRDDARDFALHRALACGWVADLLANRHRLAGFDEPGEIAVNRMVGDAAHGNRRAGGLAPRGEGDIEQIRGFGGVTVEQFVEIPHPIEQQAVGMPRLDAQVLPHHGGMGVGRRPGVIAKGKTELLRRGSWGGASRHRERDWRVVFKITKCTWFVGAAAALYVDR